METRKRAVRLGFAPTRRGLFSREDAIKYKRMLEEKMCGWDVDFVGLDALNGEGLLYQDSDVAAAEKLLREADVDALFLPHCNFGSESSVALLAKALGKPALLYGPRDENPKPDGLRLRDSQCGTFATSKALQRLGVPFSYIVSSRVDSTTFEVGFRRFMGAASVVKAFRGLLVGQIGVRPESFWSVMVNESELMERFGIRVIPITISEMVERVEIVKRTRADEVAVTVADLAGRIDCTGQTPGSLDNIAGLKLAILDWVDEAGLDTVAIQCWTALQGHLGVAPCLVNAELSEIGLPIACESDIHGAVASVLLQAAGMGASPVFFSDLTIRHPDNDNAELLWHCGPFPHSLARPGTPTRLIKHPTLESGCDGACDWEIKGGDITVARFDGLTGEYFLFAGECRGTEGPASRGTYVWMEVDDWPAWERKFIYGPYIHHVACMHGKYADILAEACRFIPGLCPDSV